MEFTREIYWNVGNSAGVLVPMYLLTLIAFAALGYGFWKRITVYRQGQALDRTDQFERRIVAALRDILLQRQVLRVTGPGVAHAFFFWGFLLLFIGTCLIVIQVDFSDPLFGVKFLRGTFYKLFSITLDLAGLVAMVMLGGLFVRCYLVRPEGLENKSDDLYMHTMLFAILLSGFVIEGARMAVTELATPLAILASFWNGFSVRGG
ncbi:MAG: hypothetical protein K0A93_00660 [Desulfuromonadaceae bacterium]|nr:hypothetical protein [Desulfuromonadaceae bacterium]